MYILSWKKALPDMREVKIMKEIWFYYFTSNLGSPLNCIAVAPRIPFYSDTQKISVI